MTEFGIIMEPSPGHTAPLAAAVEAMGFDILLCPDTQCLAPDPWGQLSLAAARTKRLRLGTGVTNPLTRDVSVSAGALATLQLESGGRALCGIGRGDSSTAHIGRRSATTAELRLYIEQLRDYLAAAEVVRDGHPSRLRWLQNVVLPTVPIDVACTGPAAIRMAADVADRVSFAVGSAPERIDWALATLQARLEQTGRSRASIRVGAFINLVCDPDEERAIGLARMGVGMVAHFAGMPHAAVAQLPDRLRPVALAMQEGYDMARHAQDDGAHLAQVDDEFVDWFAIAGPPSKCRQRLGALIERGLDHVYLLGGASVVAPHGARQASLVEQSRLFAEEVMPGLR